MDRNQMSFGRHGDVRAFVRLSRPWFLLGPGLLFLVGVADSGAAHFGGLIAGLVMVWSTQLTAHYVNEYADVTADRLVTRRTPFSGGSGVLVSGDLAPVVALRAAYSTTLVALIATSWVGISSWRAALAGLIALAVSWAYSMPPFRLLSTGWGELVTSITVAGLVPVTGALLMGGRPSPVLWWVVGAGTALHFAMMLVFELPDLASDRAAGKRVLGVRLGRRSTVGAVASAHIAGIAAGATRVGPSGLWMVVAVFAMTSWFTAEDHPLVANAAAVLAVIGSSLLGLSAVA